MDVKAEPTEKKIQKLKDDEEFEDFEEDEDFEEEEEEEEENEDGPTKKRRKMSASQFVNLEAAVDDDDDDDEEIGDAEDEGIVDDISSVDGVEEAHHRRSYKFNQLDSDKSVNELVDRLTRQEQETVEYFEEPTEYEAEIIKRTIVPKQSDPMIWMVHCTRGKEKEVAFALLGRFLVYKDTPLKPLIFSAICHDNNLGVIYVEARSESHITAAISGLAFVKKKKLKLIPREEMLSLLKVAEPKTIKVGDWVRISRGLYKGDLAQVESTEILGNKDKYGVRLAPRLDIAGWIKKRIDGDDRNTSTSNTRKKGIRASRPPSKLFNPVEIIEIAPDEVRKEIDDDGSVWETWDNQEFVDGFLYKIVDSKSLITDNIQPTLEERNLFISKKENGSDNTQYSVPLEKKKIKLNRGDIVQVIKGELIGFIGTIVSTEGDNAQFLPQDGNLIGLKVQTVPLTYLAKYFKPGNRVKVMNGTYKDETGMISSVNGDKASVVSDSTRKEFEVLLSDIQETVETNAGKVQLGIYDLLDLVQLDDQTIGVIVQIHAGTADILDNINNVRTIGLHEIVAKKNIRNNSFTLSNDTVISLGDMVEVLGGQYSGTLGTIKHMFSGKAWLQCREVRSNSGIICVNCTNLKAISTSSTAFRPSFFPMRDRRQGALLRAQVLITAGQWKGYKGIVKSVSEGSPYPTVRIQLCSGSRLVSITEDKIKNLNLEQPQYSTSSSRDHLINDTNLPVFNNGDQTPARFETPRALVGISSMNDKRDINDPWNPNFEPVNDFKNVPPTPGNILPTTPGLFSMTPSNLMIPPTPGGFNVTIPQTPGNLFHQTPGNFLVPQTPGSGFSIPQTPYPGVDFKNVPLTPGVGHSAIPQTPGCGMTIPMTPGGLPSTIPITPGGVPPTPDGTNLRPSDAFENQSSTEEVNNWFTENIEVIIKAPGPHQDKLGYISKVMPNDCVVTLLSDESVQVDVPKSQLDYVRPSQKKECLMILSGEFKGQIGTLLNLDANSENPEKPDCIVKILDEVTILSVDLLAKYYS